MDIYQTLEAWTVVVLLLVLFALLFLQVAMFRRFRHISFLLFSVGSALCIVYAAFSAVPFFYAIANSQRLLLFQCSCIAAVVAAILAVWGTASLLRSYSRLFQVTQQSARSSA